VSGVRERQGNSACDAGARQEHPWHEAARTRMRAQDQPRNNLAANRPAASPLRAPRRIIGLRVSLSPVDEFAACVRVPQGGLGLGQIVGRHTTMLRREPSSVYWQRRRPTHSALCPPDNFSRLLGPRPAAPGHQAEDRSGGVAQGWASVSEPWRRMRACGTVGPGINVRESMRRALKDCGCRIRATMSNRTPLTCGVPACEQCALARFPGDRE
jgi:hypothetical protein